MTALSRETVKNELFEMLQDLGEDWEYSGELTEDTGIFGELGFESIDAVALGSAIEEHFQQSLPFAEFLTKAKDDGWTDITIGQFLDFLMVSLDRSAAKEAS